MTKKQPEPTPAIDVGRVLAKQARDIEDVGGDVRATSNATRTAIDAATARLATLAIEAPSHSPIMHGMPLASRDLRAWDELVEDAKEIKEGFEALLTDDEIQRARRHIDQIGDSALTANRLDRFDYCIAGVAGVLAALADIFLVRVPKHPGFLGSRPDEGGWLSNEVKRSSDDPEQTIRHLERAFPVSIRSVHQHDIGACGAASAPNTSLSIGRPRPNSRVDFWGSGRVTRHVHRNRQRWNAYHSSNDDAADQTQGKTFSFGLLKRLGLLAGIYYRT